MRKLYFLAALIALIVSSLFLSDRVFANGTETLGPRTVPAGSGLVAAGTGLNTQPGMIEINVPGDEVKRAYLYWGCRGSGDNSVLLDGAPVTGALIGGLP